MGLGLSEYHCADENADGGERAIEVVMVVGEEILGNIPHPLLHIAKACWRRQWYEIETMRSDGSFIVGT